MAKKKENPTPEVVEDDVMDVEDITVHSDLLGAARALCGRDEGIACVLGTGSNSCQWDGEKIVKHVKSGGFIIGDDGSAS